METAYAREMTRQRLPNRLREHHPAVAVALPGSDGDFVVLEINVLHPQLCAFEETKARSIQQHRHDPSHARQVCQHGGDFLTAQYDWNPGRTFGADEVVEPRHIDGQDALVEEE